MKNYREAPADRKLRGNLEFEGLFGRTKFCKLDIWKALKKFYLSILWFAKIEQLLNFGILVLEYVVYGNFIPNSNLNGSKMVSCMQCDDHNTTTLFTSMDVTSLPLTRISSRDS